MNALTRTLWEELSADATLIGLMGSYAPNEGDDEVPSWFTTPQSPERAGYPLGLIAGPLRGTRRVPCKSPLLMDFEYEISAVKANDGDSSALGSIIDRAQEVVKESALVGWTGWAKIRTEIDGPYELESDDLLLVMGFRARISAQKL